MPKTEQSRRISVISPMAKKSVKKSAKKVKPAAKQSLKKAVKKAVKKAAKKTVKKASVKSAPAKSAKKAVKKTLKPAIKKSNRPASKSSDKKLAAVAPKFLSVNPYLTFDGNCEEAFNFYRSVFGGDFSYVGRFKDMPPSPEGKPVSETEGRKIMHISLPISKETALMGSDSSEEFGHATVFGNNFTISINAPGEKEADRLFNELSGGGKATMPMSKTFWGSYFGMLTDKFGIQWMISC